MQAPHRALPGVNLSLSRLTNDTLEKGFVNPKG